MRAARSLTWLSSLHRVFEWRLCNKTTAARAVCELLNGSLPRLQRRAAGPKACLASGNAHSMVVTKERGVVCFGYGRHGRLGNGSEDNAAFPFSVPLPVGMIIKCVSAGGVHSMALSSVGQVLTWGYGVYGQLGLGDTVTPVPEKRSVPTLVPDLEGVTAIGAGHSHSLAIKGGAVYTWGEGSFGGLGLGDTKHRLVPTRVPELQGIVAVDAGESFSVALSMDGVVHTWGCNDVGQLGVGDWENRKVPTRVDTLSHVVDVAAGYYHTLAVTSDGAIFSWGSGVSGKLGHDDHATVDVPRRIAALEGVRIVRVGAGWYHSMAVSEEGRLYVWGCVGEGMLGLDDQMDERGNLHVPTLVEGVEGVEGCVGGKYHSLLSTRGGAVMSFGKCGREGLEWGVYRGPNEGTGENIPSDGRLGLGADVGRAVEATAIADLTVDRRRRS